MDDTGDANPANKLLTESGKRSVLKRSRPTKSPRKMSYLALDRRTAKPPFVSSNPTRASKNHPYNMCVALLLSLGIGHELVAESSNGYYVASLISLALDVGAQPQDVL